MRRAKESISNLLQGRVPVNKLIVSKSFREGYSYERKGVCPECDKTWAIKEDNGKKVMIIPSHELKAIYLNKYLNFIIITNVLLLIKIAVTRILNKCASGENRSANLGTRFE